MSSLNRSQGFTLVEVLVAITILAVGLMGVIEGMARTEQAFRVSHNLVTASQILEEKLAETEMTVLQIHHLRTETNDGKEVFPGREFLWARRIRPYQDPSIEDQTKINRIEISVRWKEGPLRKNELGVESLIVNREKTQ